ncbi:tetratricopeptide repeat protein [Streptomyces sp. NBC_01775]|uniref:SEL1-like repeat protein n=1 Tax=Streptomyces sp. NBC_01775 TaxID=2975939 RepID=UPI002DD8EDD8|nr:tetratricopeptide repeat protein [Streptomyces sp. NBC_01775]WSB77798.1 tetratricopeptide repeat protein [Streptomyces sp. NBC_01775]
MTSADTGTTPSKSERLRAAAEGGDAHSTYEYGEHLVSQGQVDQALPWLEQSAEAGEPRAARLRAIAAKDRGQWETAQHWYGKAAEWDGDCAFGLAELFVERLEDEERAAEWYAKGTALGSLKCRTNGAVLLARQGRIEEAEEELEQAAGDGDDVADGILEHIRGLEIRTVRCEEEIEELVLLAAKPAQERTEDEDEELENRLEEFLEDEDFGELHTTHKALLAYPHLVRDVEGTYRKARELNVPDTHESHALLLFNLGRYEDACRVLEEALTLHPDSRALARMLSAVHFQYGELDAYEASLLPGAEAGDPLQQYRLGRHFRRQRRSAEARRWLEAAEASAEPRDKLDDDIAGELERLAEAEEGEAPALSAEEEARLPGLLTAAESGDRAAAFELGGLMERLCRYPEAVRHYRSAAADGDPQASYALGRMLHEECGAWEKAVVPLYRPAAEAGDPDAIEGLGALYARSDEEIKAEWWLRQAADLGRPEAAGWVGNRVGDEYGDRQEAVRWWTRATHGGKVWYGWRAGKVLVGQGEYEQAEELLRLAWTGREEQQPLNEAAYWLARALKGQGRVDEALEWMRTAGEVHSLVQAGYTGFMRTSLFDPKLDLAEILVKEIGTEAADEEAEALLADVLKYGPYHRTARHLAARIAERRGDVDAAREHLEQAYTPKGEETGPLLTAEDVAGALRNFLRF